MDGRRGSCRSGPGPGSRRRDRRRQARQVHRSLRATGHSGCQVLRVRGRFSPAAEVSRSLGAVSNARPRTIAMDLVSRSIWVQAYSGFSGVQHGGTPTAGVEISFS